MARCRHTKDEDACARLKAAGWTYSHTATVSIYRYAGTVSEMQTRKGYEYCRVHVGKCVGQHAWQLTYVYKRPVTA